MTLPDTHHNSQPRSHTFAETSTHYRPNVIQTCIIKNHLIRENRCYEQIVERARNQKRATWLYTECVCVISSKYWLECVRIPFLVESIVGSMVQHVYYLRTLSLCNSPATHILNRSMGMRADKAPFFQIAIGDMLPAQHWGCWSTW